MADAITTPLDPASSTLSPNFAPYVYNMLGKGEAAANLPYQPFEGTRFAGPSGLQQQAFGGLGSLGVPSQYGEASNFLTQAARGAGATEYAATPGVNFFQSPGAYKPTVDFTQGVGQQQYQAGAFTPGFN